MSRLDLFVAAAAPDLHRFEWDEEAHPRDAHGRFGEGGASADIPPQIAVVDGSALSGDALHEASQKAQDAGNAWAADHPVEAEAVRAWLANGRITATPEQQDILKGMVAKSPEQEGHLFRAIVVAPEDVPKVGDTVKGGLASWTKDENVARLVGDKRQSNERWARQTGIPAGEGRIVILRENGGRGLYVSPMTDKLPRDPSRGVGNLTVAATSPVLSASEFLRDGDYRVTGVTDATVNKAGALSAEKGWGEYRGPNDEPGQQMNVTYVDVETKK